MIFYGNVILSIGIRRLAEELEEEIRNSQQTHHSTREPEDQEGQREDNQIDRGTP